MPPKKSKSTTDIGKEKVTNDVTKSKPTKPKATNHNIVKQDTTTDNSINIVDVNNKKTKPVNKSVKKSVKKSVNKSVNKSVKKSVNKSVRNLTDDVTESMDDGNTVDGKDNTYDIEDTEKILLDKEVLANIMAKIKTMFPDLPVSEEGDISMLDTSVLEDKLRDTDIDKEDTWKVLDAYFAQYDGRQLMSYHFYSYEQFIEKYMGDVIEQFNPIIIYHEFDQMIEKYIVELSINLKNYTIGKPVMSEPDEETVLLTPGMARDRNLSYSAPLTIDIEMTRTIRYKNQEDIEKWQEWNVKYGHLIRRPGRPSKNTQYNIYTGQHTPIIPAELPDAVSTEDIPPAPVVGFTENVKKATVFRVNFGKIPVMVGSKYCNLTKQQIHPVQASECHLDMGGYFIVNGNEKVIIGQERIAENKIFVFNKQKQNKGREYEAEVRSIADDGFNIVMTNIIKYNPKTNIMTTDMGGKSFAQPYNLFIVLRSLGVKTDEDLLNCIAIDHTDTVLGSHIAILCRETMNDFRSICKAEGNMHTVYEVREYIIRHMKIRTPTRDIPLTTDDRRKAFVTSAENELLPHIRKDLDKKALFLGAMARKLLKVRMGLVEMDDRDSFQNKRVETTGYLLANLFRQCLNTLIKEMTKNITTEIKNVIDNTRGVVTKEILDVITINNIYKIVKPACVENGMKYSMATGNWGVKSGGKTKTRISVARMLSRLSYLSYLSDMCRVVCPTDKKKKSGKIVGPRKQHASQWGFICPSETPEGHPVGLIKNKAIAATITVQYNSAPVRLWLEMNAGCERATLDNITSGMGKCLIYVNGDIIGYHVAPEKVFSQFKVMRRAGKFNPHITINWDVVNDEMFIYTDAGRLIRPVYIVGNNNRLCIRKWHTSMLSTSVSGSDNGGWNSLIMTGLDSRCNQTIMPQDYFTINTQNNTQNNTSDSGTIYSANNTGIINGHIPPNGNNNGNRLTAHDMMSRFATLSANSQAVIEYIDIEEVNNCLIATTPEELKHENSRNPQYINNYTHCEMHPGLILGVLACVIPFPDHNQSPRNAYQSCMGKQAMSYPTTNLLRRLDTMAYAMCHLERPIVTSRFGNYVHYDKLPYGMNAIVAIATYGGYNQEDSIILNGHSVDMGMFRTIYYRVHKSDEKKVQNHKEEKFCRPDPRYTKGIKPGDYSKLDERGFVRVNEYVTNRDIIMGKKYPLKGAHVNGHNLCKDSSISLKSNEAGWVDKVFVSRNEEGFLTGKVRIRDERIPSIGSKFASRNAQKGTVGMILPREQMPFTANGLTPDIIMTPHAIPSRMTIGQLLESVLGKAATHYGGYADCTPFADIDVNKLGDILESQGFEACGNEVLYSGISGEQLNVAIFMGPTYYQRLKHMAEDKVHSRNSGPVVQLTRQPAEGRSREGGLRVGEMEKDCINSHGAAAFLKERMLDVSDKFEMYICGHCGNAAVVNPTEDIDIYICNVCDNYNNFQRVAIPYAAKLLSQEIQGMGMNMRVVNS